MTYKGAPMMSKQQTWATPWGVVEHIEGELGISFDLDAAAEDTTAKAPAWFTAEDDALQQDWFGDVWLNPPFGRGGALQRQFIEKAARECELGHARTVTCLIPARTDTKLFHDVIARRAHRVWFVNGRINFLKPGSTVPGANATFPSMVVLFKRRPRHPRKRTRQRRGVQMTTMDIPQHVRRGL